MCSMHARVFAKIMMLCACLSRLCIVRSRPNKCSAQYTHTHTHTNHLYTSVSYAPPWCWKPSVLILWSPSAKCMLPHLCCVVCTCVNTRKHTYVDLVWTVLNAAQKERETCTCWMKSRCLLAFTICRAATVKLSENVTRTGSHTHKPAPQAWPAWCRARTVRTLTFQGGRAGRRC